jgi:TonB family protein
MSRSRRTAGFVVLFLFLVALFVIATMPKTSSSSQVAETSSQVAETASQSSDDTPEPKFSVTYNNVVYYGAMSSDVGVAILNVESGKYMAGELGMERADGKFINVTVAIMNHQNTAITMDTGLFEILDSGGNVYSASEKSMELGPNGNLFLAQINPGVTKTGQVIFDVPESLSLEDLSLRFRGGMTGDSTILALSVNSKVNELPSPEPAAAPVPATPSPTSPTTQSSPEPADAASTVAAPSAITPAQTDIPSTPAPAGMPAAAPQNSDAASVPQGSSAYAAGGDVLPPQIISAVRPNYTQPAIDAKLDGTVAVGLIVDANGNPQSVHVLKSLGLGLDECAVDAVRQYRFRPGTLHGNPIPVSITVDVVFNRFFASTR